MRGVAGDGGVRLGGSGAGGCSVALAAFVLAEFVLAAFVAVAGLAIATFVAAGASWAFAQDRPAMSRERTNKTRLKEKGIIVLF